MPSSHSDPSSPRRGRIRQWFARLLGFDDAAVDTGSGNTDLPVRCTVNRVVPVEFTTPARGDAYDFSIAVDICFCAEGVLSKAELHRRLDSRVPEITAKVKTAARPAARYHAILRPAEAESAVTDAVRSTITEALLDGVDSTDLGCQLTAEVREVRVDIPQEVRDLRRREVDEQVKIDARFERSAFAARELGELRKVWSGFIQDGLPFWDTPYAVYMALQPDQAASTLFSLRKDRKSEAADLVETVSKVAVGHERMDLLEFSLATDSALSRTYELLGIAAPPAGPGSTFDNAEDAEGTS